MWLELTKKATSCSNDTIDEVSTAISFFELMQLDKPFNYVSNEEWMDWCQTLQGGANKNCEIIDVAKMLGLQWPQSNLKEICDYCNISLPSLLSLESGLRRTLFLVIAFASMNPTKLSILAAKMHEKFENNCSDSDVIYEAPSDDETDNDDFITVTSENISPQRHEISINPNIESKIDWREAKVFFGDLKFDIDNHRAWRGHNFIDVNLTIFCMLLYMVHNPNRYLSYEMINHYAIGNSHAMTSKKIDESLKILQMSVDKGYSNKLGPVNSFV